MNHSIAKSMLATLLFAPVPAAAEQALSACLAGHRVAITVGESFHPLDRDPPADHSLRLRGMVSETLRNLGTGIVALTARPNPLGSVDGLAEPMAQAEERHATLLVAFGLDARETPLVSAYLNGDQYPLRTVRFLLNGWVVDPSGGDVLAEFTVKRTIAANSTDDAIAELNADNLADPLARALRLACEALPAGPPRAAPPSYREPPPPAPAPPAVTPKPIIPISAPEAREPRAPSVAVTTPRPPDSQLAGYGRRIALVIGNNAYQTLGTLRTAASDAESMRRELEGRGFKVIFRRDATRRAMNDAIAEFRDLLSSDAVAVIYYAGHGVQINNANYLLPVDLEARRDSQVMDDAVNLGALLEEVSAANAKFTLAIIDACRNNPFKTMGRSAGGHAGLAPPVGNADGTMVVYSAGANQEALDRLSEEDPDPNGLFTRELLKVMRLPGLDVHDMINRVRLSVIAKARAIEYTQTPAVYDQSTGVFIFAPENDRK